MTRPVLYDFFATWCGPCKMQTPIIEELAKTLGDAVEIKKVDVDENMALGGKIRHPRCADIDHRERRQDRPDP